MTITTASDTPPMEVPAEETKARIDQKIFWPSIIFSLALIIPFVLLGDTLNPIISRAYAFLTGGLGWAFLTYAFVGMFFLAWVAFGPLGHIKLGSLADKPAYSNTSWSFMILASGFGIGIVNWSMIEPLIVFEKGPLGYEPFSSQAMELAVTYGFFHWGPLYWISYMIVVVPICYFLLVRRPKLQRISLCFEPLIGAKAVNGTPGKLIDIFVVFSLIGGIGCTLGSAVPLVAGLLAATLNIEQNLFLECVVLFSFAAIIMVSLSRPISTGMKIASDLNGWIVVGVMATLVILGPTAFLLNNSINMVGNFISLFPQMITWTDPVDKGGFPQDWTIFYTAWYIAYAPMMGLFIASISRGRTIKTLVLGCMGLGALAGFLFFCIVGSFALHLQYTGVVDLVTNYNTNGLAHTVALTLKNAPISTILLPVYLVMAALFLITTIDACTRVLAGMTNENITADTEPTVKSRMIWCVTIVALCFGVLIVGGLEVVKALAVIPTIPLVFICGLAAYCMILAAKADFPNLFKAEYHSLEEDKSGNLAPAAEIR